LKESLEDRFCAQNNALAMRPAAPFLTEVVRLNGFGAED
jgi:hypothetical protein